MKKLLSILLIFTLIFSTFSVLGTSKVEASRNDWDTQRYGDVLDIGPKLRKLEDDEEYREKLDKNIKEKAAKINFNEVQTASEEDQNSNFTFNGGTKFFLGYDNGNYYFKEFTLRSIGEHVEIWVANDLSYGDDDDRPAHIVTQEQVDKLRDEFDNNIYIKDTEFFGKPDAHTGEKSLLEDWGSVPEDYYVPQDGKERVIILVDNIRDENYYDPTYPFFIAGFYSSAYEAYFDRNIINIDSSNWEERLESTFFGTTAHEFQHLIHDDNDSDEETWINEGMSDFAEYLCEYGHPMGHVNFFLDHPENSLVVWDEYYSYPTGPETLADYGQAYLLQLYFYDQFGKEFVRELAVDSDNGIESVNKILKEFGVNKSFNDIYRDFSVALAVDKPEPGNGVYNFESIDLQVNFESALETDKPGVPAWGSDYIKLEEAKKIENMIMDGVELLPTPWKVVDNPLGEGKVLWGNQGNEMDNFLIFEADLTDVDKATLKFDNYIQIEEQWDFGIVQVSTDNGRTWTTLENVNTRSDIVEDGYPKIKENLPGFTGYYDSWVNEEFNLTPYAGKKVHIAFRYMTDWGYNDPGWFIKNIEIPEIGLKFSGESLEGFMSLNELLKDYVEYQVSFVNEKSLGNGENISNYRVLNIDPYNVTEEQVIKLRDFLSGGNNYMIIWYAAGIGDKNPVDYSYKVITKNEAAKIKK
ncbi:choice-of-anchor J domain-containing protein [Thermohalobacter berrensis]|uniref:Uncharacterized protein n=1 Tax=Thermohalobacter berrensis TaxID=99594 RepID=A0A419SUG5_9FIRM|nr:choice-of-anchor J domain-containing protein [Thermohalobacter berrensis]RKD28824.1 hypothetical protein BET03_07280 [Thermohalobacter berrensis]